MDPGLTGVLPVALNRLLKSRKEMAFETTLWNSLLSLRDAFIIPVLQILAGVLVFPQSIHNKKLQGHSWLRADFCTTHVPYWIQLFILGSYQPSLAFCMYLLLSTQVDPHFLPLSSLTLCILMPFFIYFEVLCELWVILISGIPNVVLLWSELQRSSLAG